MSAEVKLFWESEEQVSKFAAREPDHRLAELVKTYPNPSQVQVLDMGCAGGRNTVLLAELGFSFYALDGSLAMVEKTKERLLDILTPAVIEERVFHLPMHRLERFRDQQFDLIIALGIFHNATSQDEWDQTLSEASRVLKSGGRLLMSNFSPSSMPEGVALIPDQREPNVYSGFGPGKMYLLAAGMLDQEMKKFGLLPVNPTETVHVETEQGKRVTINALLKKR